MAKKIYLLIFTLFILTLLVGCASIDSDSEMLGPTGTLDSDEVLVEEYSMAYFAGGCFWCTEAAFEKTEGVIEVYSGFSGGEEINPSYKQVSSGETGHTETIEVIYDHSMVSYEELVHVLLMQIDPTDATGSFVDRGFQYRSAIFYQTDNEREIAQKVLDQLNSLDLYGEGDNEFAVEVVSFDAFYSAEDHHQNYHTENSIRYNYYRSRSGRDQFLEQIWTEENIAKFEDFLGKDDSSVTVIEEFVKPSDEELREMLTDLQYEVTQEEGTEKAFTGEYDDFYEDGIYVDIISGEVLYSSIDKYDSGTGWPSFTKPLVEENIVYVEDNILFYKRTEIRSKLADSHLGHVFSDGPEDKGGLRYCMNSAALRFVAVEDMEAEGYGEYLYLFE